jgi:hypothetical protein
VENVTVKPSSGLRVPQDRALFALTWAKRRPLEADFRTLPPSHISKAGNPRFVRTISTLGLCLLLASFLACTKPPQPEPEQPATRQQTGLESLPAPNPAKYPPFSKLSSWQNPYFVVREDGIGLVDLNNREIHILKIEEIPAELASLPSSAWPYGRVVLVAQAVPKDASDQTKATLRANRALLLGTLKELDVQYQEAP